MKLSDSSLQDQYSKNIIVFSLNKTDNNTKIYHATIIIMQHKNSIYKEKNSCMVKFLK